MTDLQTVKFDIASDDMEDRKKWIKLVLKIGSTTETPYRLVFRDAETGIEQQTLK